MVLSPLANIRENVFCHPWPWPTLGEMFWSPLAILRKMFCHPWPTLGKMLFLSPLASITENDYALTTRRPPVNVTKTPGSSKSVGTSRPELVNDSLRPAGFV